MTALPVVMYHSVGGHMPAKLAALSVPVQLLAEQLQALSESGYRLVGLSEALGAEPTARVVAVTFDDAYRDFHDQAMPILARLGARVTQYVPTAYVGATSDWLPGSGADLPMMAAEEIRAAAGAEHEIGSHGHLHVPLDVVGRRTLDHQLRCSKESLEQMLDLPVTSFCYPHGYHSVGVRRSVRAAGFANACAIGHGLHRVGADPYAVQRLMVTPDHTPEEVVRLVTTGATGALPALKRAFGPGWRTARWMAKAGGRTWT